MIVWTSKATNIYAKRSVGGGRLYSKVWVAAENKVKKVRHLAAAILEQIKSFPLRCKI